MITEAEALTTYRAQTAELGEAEGAEKTADGVQAEIIAGLDCYS